MTIIIPMWVFEVLKYVGIAVAFFIIGVVFCYWLFKNAVGLR